MFDVIDGIFHDFASVYITYILIYRDISIIYFPLPCFHDSNYDLFLLPLHDLFHGRSLDYFLPTYHLYCGCLGLLICARFLQNWFLVTICMYSQILLYLSKY